MVSERFPADRTAMKTMSLPVLITPAVRDGTFRERSAREKTTLKKGTIVKRNVKRSVSLSVAVLLMTLAAACPAVEKGALKTTLFANLGNAYYNPDGMTVGDATGILYLNVPNFSRMDETMKKADSAQGGYLLKVAKDGSWQQILEYPVHPITGQCGPMGLDCGPDGNLYVCDNQYFHDKSNRSRILRVVLDSQGQPTGEVETVVEGFKLANGILWHGDLMFYTDSCFDQEDGSDGNIGSGGVFMFKAEEVLNAGRGEVPPVKVASSPEDPHCLAWEKVVKLGRADGTGPDGITVDARGTVWFGNFGNGFLYGAWPDEKGNYKRDNVVNVFDALNQQGVNFESWTDLKLQCCDGICYDPETDRVIIDDSQNNAIWAFAPCKKGENVEPYIVLKNDDTDGNRGELDQPCEAIIYDGKLIFANFDWPFPGLTNSQVDPPGTLSSIPYDVIKPALQGK